MALASVLHPIVKLWPFRGWVWILWRYEKSSGQYLGLICDEYLTCLDFEFEFESEKLRWF
jgi:hypothetical protein